MRRPHKVSGRCYYSTSWEGSAHRLNLAMARQAGLHALRNDQDLARYVIEGTPTGRQLGTGSYGSVEEVRFSFKSQIICLPESQNLYH